MATNLFTTKLSRRTALAAGVSAVALTGMGRVAHGNVVAFTDPLVTLWDEWAELDVEIDRRMKACPKTSDTETGYLETRVDPLLDRSFEICNEMAGTDARTLNGIAAQARLLAEEVERYGGAVGPEVTRRHHHTRSTSPMNM